MRIFLLLTPLSYYISLVLILHLHLSTYFLHLYCTYISLVLQPLLYLHLLCTYYIFLLCLHLPCTYIFLLDLCLYFSYICCYSPNSHTSLSRTCIILTFVLYLAVTAQSSRVQWLNFGYLTPFVTFSWQLHASADYSYLSGIAIWITLELSLSLCTKTSDCDYVKSLCNVERTLQSLWYHSVEFDQDLLSRTFQLRQRLCQHYMHAYTHSRPCLIT